MFKTIISSSKQKIKIPEKNEVTQYPKSTKGSYSLILELNLVYN